MCNLPIRFYRNGERTLPATKASVNRIVVRQGLFKRPRGT